MAWSRSPALSLETTDSAQPVLDWHRLLSRYRIPEKYFLLELDELLRGRGISGLSPHELFGSVNDDFWVWALTKGRTESEVLREILPGLPSEEVQLKTNGISGDLALVDAYLMYRLFRRIYDVYRGDFESAGAVLDFGCGWGRITRFFLRDVEPDRLWGVDSNRDWIELCQATSRWGHFKQTRPFPPMDFGDDTFDLIFCYSVFSHLSEDAHRQWIEEFRRILKPGGLLIATTWGQEGIERCRRVREDGAPEYKAGLAGIFHNPDDWLARYDRGEFCFDSSEELYGDHSRWLGEACIPKEYVLRHWPQQLDVLDYLDDRRVAPQNVIVARR